MARPSSDRAAFLAYACGDDDALRREAESLVAGASPSFLETPAVAAAPPPLLGRQLGAYRIEQAIGAGGMGEVYRATDTRLGRAVAVKILPTAWAADPQRRARFEREARAIAALNHPNICTIHDVGHDQGIDFLVMELVEGESLAARLASGPLPLDRAIGLAIEIADALDKAHRQGIIHRDLKPGNVMLTRTGTGTSRVPHAKLLDFGLARIVPSAVVGATAPTDVSPMTAAGAVLGTLQYMAPEQIEGRPADARTDVFAFGALLYEMLTARRAFDGATTPALMAAILRDNAPSLTSIDPSLPNPLDRLVQTCLAKDPDDRYSTMRDVLRELRWIDASSTSIRPEQQPRRRTNHFWMNALLSGVAAAVAAGITWAATRTSPATPLSEVRFEIEPPAPDVLNVSTTTPTLTLSSDGRRLAYTTGSSTTGGPLTIRDVDELAPRRVEGSPAFVREPFFSPDGQWLAYVESRPGGGLAKIPASGGTSITLVPDVGVVRGASWASDGTIVFATTDPATGLLRVSDGGGTPTVLTTPHKEKGEADHVSPSFLPNGRGVLFTILDATADNPSVAVLDLRNGSQRVLIPGAASAHYIESGYLIYAAAGTLFSVRFDLGSLQTRGEPVTLTNGVKMGEAAGAYYTLSRTGSLAYVPATATPSAQHSLVWVDRKGGETPLKVPIRSYLSVSLSPDANRIATQIEDQDHDIWTWDLTRQILTRVTTDPHFDRVPVWTPDGQRLVFTSNRQGTFSLYSVAADGTGPVERLSTGSEFHIPTAVTPDGTRVLGNYSSTSVWDLFVSPLGKRAAAAPLLRSPASKNYPAVSPNGRYVAYQSNESGQFEIYVRPFPNVDEGRWQVSAAGGTHPIWARDGRELFFLDGSNMLTTTAVDTAAQVFRSRIPARLLSTAYVTVPAPRPYDVSPDGTRFLMIRADSTVRPSGGRIVVVLNAFESVAAGRAKE